MHLKVRLGPPFIRSNGDTVKAKPRKEDAWASSATIVAPPGTTSKNWRKNLPEKHHVAPPTDGPLRCATRRSREIDQVPSRGFVRLCCRSGGYRASHRVLDLLALIAIHVHDYAVCIRHHRSGRRFGSAFPWNRFSIVRRLSNKGLRQGPADPPSKKRAP